MATWLRSRGRSEPETAIAHMAIYRLGAVALPISRLFGDDALRYRLMHSGARAIVVEPEAAVRLEPMRAELPATAPRDRGRGQAWRT